MSLPKKVKLTLDINPPKIGTEYLKYGIDRIEELMRLTDVNTKYFPRTILLEDLDQGLFDYVNDTGMKLVIDNRNVPTFYMDNDRWGEFSKTWKFSDLDHNVPTPYITIRRIDKQAGTRLGKKYRIPQPRKFRYMDVPILDNGEVIYLRFKMPEPTNVDMIYEVALFTKYRVDVNTYDEQVLKNFASRQEYLFIKGNPLPLLFEGFAEANPIENIDGDRFFVSKYALKILGFIQDEKEFEIVKTSRKPKISIKTVSSHGAVYNAGNIYASNIRNVANLGNRYVLSVGIINNNVNNKSLVAGSNMSISATTNSLIFNASTLNSFIQLVDSVGNLEVNDIIPTPINWDTQEYSGKSISFTGGSRIYITTTGHYNISYSVTILNQSEGIKLIGSSVRKNGINYVAQLTTTSGDINTFDNEGTSQIPTYTKLLYANDYIELMVFRIGDSGSALSVPNESWIRIEKI